jgi:DNA gyrase subunit A
MKANKDGIGAVVRVETADGVSVQTVHSGSSYCSQSDLALTFGLGKNTVAWRPSYDGTRSEPVVLPARFPNLLVNGSQGIAVGMATSIPPHNLGEIVDACIEQIKNGKEILPTKALLKIVKGPDFPTGGQLFASRSDLLAIYDSGQGTLKLRGEYKVEEIWRPE